MPELPRRAGPTVLTLADTDYVVATASSTSTDKTYVARLRFVLDSGDSAEVTYGIDTAAAAGDAAGKRLNKSATVGRGRPYIDPDPVALLTGAAPERIYARCSVAGVVSVTATLIDVS